MPMFVCGILTVFMLLELLLRPTRPLRALTVFMAVTVLLYLGHCVYFMREVTLIPLTDSFYSAASPMVFPLYYIYIKCLTQRVVPWWHVALLVLPSLMCGVAVGVGYALMSPEQTGVFIESYLYRHAATSAEGLVRLQVAAHQAVQVVFAVQIVPVLWLGFRRIHRFNVMLEHNYSSVDDKRLTWVKVMLIVFTGTSIVSFVSNIVGRYRFVDDLDLLSIPSVLFSMLLFAVGYIGLKQKGIDDLDGEEHADIIHSPEPVVVEASPVAPPPPAPSPASLAAPSPEPEPTVGMSAKGKSLRERIEVLMNEQQLYLQPQLKLTDVVSALGSNRNYVYQAINVEMGKSFSEYVNCLRIEHAKKLIRSYPDLSFAEVASQSGFASQISFYRNFRHFVGGTPQSYKNSLT